MLDVVANHGHAGIAPGHLFLHGAYCGVFAVNISGHSVNFGADILGLRVQGIQLPLFGLIIGPGGFHAALLAAQALARGVQGVHPQRHVQGFLFGGIFQKLLRPRRLFFQGAHTPLKLAQYIAQTHQIIFRAGQAALGLVFAVPKARNAAGFFKYLAPLGAFAGHYLVYAALADNRVPVAPKARVQQKLVHIFQPHTLAANAVLALAAAVIPAADDYLVGVHFKASVGIVQHQVHSGVAHGVAPLRAAKNHVLHFAAAAQLFCAGFAQHPAHSV